MLSMAKIEQIRRALLIINKLATFKGSYVPTEQLLDYVSNELSVRYGEGIGCSLRTLQRDFLLIEELFGIEIKHDKIRGYYIAEFGQSSEGYEELLLNFEILSAIGPDSAIQNYVLPEHHKYPSPFDFSKFFTALRECHPVEFDYTLFRHGNKVVTKKIKPHFLKNSQHRWYLIGYDMDEKLKCFGIDRISGLSVSYNEKFKRDDSLDIPALFRESYGIWNNLNDPVEEIVIKYDSVDGAFIKSLPLHHTQEIIEETEDSITFRMNLRITNDFVMALLSRARSVEVLAPLSLRARIRDTYKEAFLRNSNN